MTLKTWHQYVQKYLFNSKEGFYELPYLSNSPKIMVESLAKLPVTQHKLAERSVYLNTSLCKGVMRYREIEEGFWILATDLTLSENIIAKAVYDKNQSCEYYFLSFSVFEYKFSFKDASDAMLLSSCWTFYKPGTEVATYFYKGTSGNFFNIVVTKKWMNRFFSATAFSKQETIKNFFNSEKGFYTWLDIAPKAHAMAKKISKILQNETEDSLSATALKKQCLKLMATFFDNSFEDNRILDNVSLNNIDYQNVAKAEKMILHHLHLPFLGIEHIASYVGISPTKLKSDFKTVFGFSMLQYHKEKNMLLAMQLIQKSDIRIQDIAAVAGYESGSKFAANFKKRFGNLPTQVRSSFVPKKAK